MSLSPSKNESVESEKMYLASKLISETGKERVKRMFDVNELGMISPEMHCIKQTSTATFSIMGIIGALSKMGEAKDKFMRHATTEVYESEFLARRKLTDAMTIAAIKGGVKNGLKYSLASCMYMTMTLSAANYNNKVTVWEHMASGAILGGLTKLNYGLKGATAAGVVGGLLGTFAGTVIVTAMWCSGYDLDKFREVNFLSQASTMKKKKNKNADDDKSESKSVLSKLDGSF